MAYLKKIDGKLHVVSENADGGETLYPVLAGWESFSGWYWFSLEIAEQDDSDKIHFGLVQGQDQELGYFSQKELESMPNKIWRIKQHDLPYAGRRRRA